MFLTKVAVFGINQEKTHILPRTHTVTAIIYAMEITTQLQVR